MKILTMLQELKLVVARTSLALAALGAAGCAGHADALSEPTSLSAQFSVDVRARSDTWNGPPGQESKDACCSTPVTVSGGIDTPAENSGHSVSLAVMTEPGTASIRDAVSLDDPFTVQAQEEPYDPWEPWNTRVFTFNKKVDEYVLKPVATGYDWVMPDPLEKGITNAFHNVGVLPRLLNNLFQAKYKRAGLETGRFLINSTLGVAGLFDAATGLFGMEKPVDEDTGQTFAVYGARPGPYLVLPLLPPLTVRDGAGYVVDLALDPVNYLLPFFAVAGLRGGNVTNDRSMNLDRFQGVEEATLDLYAAVRDAYLQKRARIIQE